MKSPILPDTYLFETKPGQEHEGMFVCITEKGRELLKELERNKKIDIKETILNDLDNNYISDHYLLQTSNISIKEIGNFQDENCIQKAYILILKEKKYFIKTEIMGQNDSHKESLALLKIKKEVSKNNTTINDISGDTIKINVLNPLYSIYDKYSKKSIITYPYIDNFQSIKQTIKQNNVTEEEINNINNILSFIKKKVNEEDGYHIFDIDEKNMVFKRSQDGSIKLTITDPRVIIYEIENKIQIFHKIFSQ